MLDPSGRGGSGYDFSRLSVLLAEDNEFIRRMVYSILSSLGIRRVQTANDGGEAYNLFKHGRFDLLIVDWVMKPIDGPALVRRVRRDKDSPNPWVPIIMLTAYSEMNRVMQARDMGVNEFLAKPVSAAQIYDRLVKVLENERPFVKTESYFGPCRRRHHDKSYRGEERRRKGSVEVPADETAEAG